MFRHEAVDRNHTIVSLYRVAKNVRESRDNLGVSKYSVGLASMQAVIATQTWPT
jgi:hypothetical protein